jgi:hypothetical protein
MRMLDLNHHCSPAEEVRNQSHLKPNTVIIANNAGRMKRMKTRRTIKLRIINCPFPAKLVLWAVSKSDFIIILITRYPTNKGQLENITSHPPLLQSG